MFQVASTGLSVSLLFTHWLPLLFFFATGPPCSLPSVTVRMYCPHGSKSPFSKIIVDSGTFSNFIAELSNERRPLFWTFVLILF